MDIQKDINKEVLKSDEEKVEDLAKDAEDLEKAVEKDIKDKVEKAEEVNDAKAEPLDAKDGSGKAVKAVVASDKEFKDKQERDKEVVPGLEKAELEEGLTEAKKTLDDVYEDPGLESIWETKWKELVPATGKAKTPIGEVMRCFAKVSHEYFQNGSILGKGYNNRSNYDAANDMDRALQANGLNDNELCKLWDKIWATRSEAAYDHYLAEFYEKFINKYLKNDTVSEGLNKAKNYTNGSGKTVKDVATEVKPFTEKLELNEAAETQTEIKELLSDYLLNELSYDFEDNIAIKAASEVKGYDADWCAEEPSRDYNEKRYEFIDELVEDLMAMCPLEESLEEAVSSDLINAIMWSYGCSKTEASKKAKSMDEERKKLLIQGFKDNAKKSFYSESLKEDIDAKNDLDILKSYLPSNIDYRKYYDIILVRKDIDSFMDAITKDGWKRKTSNHVGSEVFSKDNLNIYVWVSESPKVCYVRLLDEPLKEDVELWDSDRVVDLARYYAKKYPYTEDEKIIKAIIKTMQKQGSTLPSDLKEVEKIYYDTVNEDNDYDAEYGEPYDESLDESKLDEAIPREVAQALKNSNNQEIRNSGGSKYKIPGMPQYNTGNVDSKDALNKSNVDYEKAEFNKISKEEALNTYKTEPQNLLLIVSDDHGYGNVEQKAIWFEASGDRFGRVENVPDEKAPRRRDGSLITDTKYMTIKQLIDCADSCYWTNQRDVTRDPVLQDIRSKNPESRNYTGLDAKGIEQEYSPKNSGRYYVDNNVSRGVSPEYGWSSWTAVRQRRYDNLKARIEDLEAKLASGNLDRSEKIEELERLQGLKSELSQLEDTRAKAIGAQKDYNARKRYLTAEQAQRSTMKKFIDLKNAVENADWDLKNAQRNLDDVRKQGGTWSNDYDRRKVTTYTDQIRRLQAQIADYQRMIDELNTKLSSQQVSEEDAKAIADAEANFAEVQNRVQSQKDELNSILDRARARHQNTESLEEDLKVTINFDSFEPYGQAVDTYNRIKDANKLDEADSILEELYPDGIDEESLNDILAYSPEWLLNELGLADDEEKAMLDVE